MISIVTPTLDEADNLRLRARELREQSGPWEWIVSDGGSRDETRQRARRLGARVVDAPRGRGAQLRAGAEAAQGDVLLFLHADTRLPAGALDSVRRAVWEQGSVGGNFTLRFEGSPAVRAVFDRYYALQQRLFDVYYGDSAIFVRRDVYARIGGFASLPLMEDYDLVRRLEAFGPTCKLPLQVVTSGRRYEGRVVRSVGMWAGILAAYHAGVSPAWLARLYS